MKHLKSTGNWARGVQPVCPLCYCPVVHDMLLLITMLNLLFSSDQCNDLHTCCELFSLIVTSLLALFAAVYLSYNKNVLELGLNWYQSGLIDVNILMVATVFPEWTFGVAFRNRKMAQLLCVWIEQPRLEAFSQWAVYCRDTSLMHVSSPTSHGKMILLTRHRAAPKSIRVLHTVNHS